MLDIIKDTNQERKLTPSEKNKLSEVLVDIGREKRRLANNKADVETKSAQCRYEESIGADKIKNQIKHQIKKDLRQDFKDNVKSNHFTSPFF